MADDTILSWNVPNWISVILMALVGFGLLAVVQKIWLSVRDKKGGAQ